jgi:hypothetical protein
LLNVFIQTANNKGILLKKINEKVEGRKTTWAVGKEINGRRNPQLLPS